MAPPKPEEPSVNKAAPERPRPRLFGGLGQTPSPYPPFGISMARGLRSVGAWPVVLGVAFLSLLATWAVFVALGVDTTPRFMAVMMALSPANLFSDVPVAFGTSDTTSLTIASILAFATLRAVTYGGLTLLISSTLRDGAPSIREALARLPRVAATLFAIYILEVALVVVVLQVLVGFLGQLSILAVIAAIYFLLMVPVVAVVEGASTQEALRRGFRAARLPGIRHLGLVMVYFIFIFWVSAITPFGLLAPATPTALHWAFALAATFIHAGVLGALVFRWLAVRDQVPADARSRAR